MQYRYVKSHPLNDEQRRRLRISLATHLRLSGVINRPTQKRWVNELLHLFAAPDDTINPQVLNWLLSYGTPKMLVRLIDLLAGKKPQHVLLRAIAQADCEDLLPREYIVPDFQKVQNTEHPKTALVCFTGNAQQLYMPVQVFHCLVAKRFDMIFYLRDFERQHFTQGIPGIADSLSGLNKALRQQIPDDCHIAVLSTSSGGYAAACFAEEIVVDRLALFSPSLIFKDTAAISDSVTMRTDCIRLFFAGMNDFDKQLADEWADTGYAPAIRLLNGNSHATLPELLEHGHFESLLDWLLGGKDLAVGEALEKAPLFTYQSSWQA